MDDTEVALGDHWLPLCLPAQPIEKHLVEGHPLTDTNLELLSTTATGLQTAIQVWKRKNGMLVDQPPSSNGES